MTRSEREEVGLATEMNDDNDKILSLPEHMQHHIVSFRRNMNEVVRTSSLSKSWLQTWRSLPINDFDQEFMEEWRFVGFVTMP
ncbi:hypothetical protein CRG98_046176 [Punica granatum]|uniref:F-box domain-containing protein n=1 Tax=Punica granatum TaxID=22663 RepID=A0A2I0HP14_PUNGR|nr:hypothetical protein CRG98_046176 [Punica granatum]